MVLPAGPSCSIRRTSERAPVQQPVYQPEPSYPQHQAYQPEQVPVQRSQFSAGTVLPGIGH